MTFLEERDFSDVPTIPEYYKGKTIFITGGSGFMGKILIEKLLYSCPELDRIYLLLRNKRGMRPEDRLADIYKSPCFERLRKERPDAFMSKVFFIAGEVNELDLGMSDEDWSLIANRTHIIFHVAASVRFDDHLTKATNLNVRGTRELVRLAGDASRLECFVHVSTSYANTDRNPVEEVMYPAHADWRDTLHMCETMPPDDVQVVTHKYLGEMPNTYVFTKQLAEHVVYEQKGKLPIIIIRPSIVVSSLKEPIPGWIENFNGPAGIIVASGKGLIRAIYSDPKITNDYIPVDVITRGIVASAWCRGTKKFSPTDDIPIYNMCSGGYNCVSSLDLVKMGESLTQECPLDSALWARCSTVTDSKLLYNFKALFFQLIPSMLIDTLLWLLGKKPLLVKIQRKIYTANYIALAYYSTQEWTFKIDNFLKLRSVLKEEDKEDFFYELENIDIYNYFKVCVYGGRKYLMKEKDEDLPAAKVHDTRIRLIAKITNHVFYGLVFVWMCNKICQCLSPYYISF
ncbi:putative fatty acyl-CoA reductase CG5065 [Aricia agestis]|uniref:putative fatty acyl-CoA reductase CG5065 n=1 Tax=Aricia agestis TaxID=91739 RepID=UPI001C20BD19|nr:putative fatty acyl-CoA reductase CG5065 [Aricia agestis]